MKDNKKGVLFCSCSGSYPSMKDVDFWALAERVRLEEGEKIEFMALHPRLCEEDGERLMGRLLSDDVKVVTAACAEKRQEKLLKEGFEKAGVPMDSEHWAPVSMAQSDTESVASKIREIIED
jgi:heterodisulfide reductase subunit A-like polyferredoxin